MADIQTLILMRLQEDGEIPDTVSLAKDHSIDHAKITGQALSLEAAGLVEKQVLLSSSACFMATYSSEIAILMSWQCTGCKEEQDCSYS